MDIWIEMPNLSCLRNAFQNNTHEMGLVRRNLNKIVFKSITNVTGVAFLGPLLSLSCP